MEGMAIADIAQLAHEANRSYCASIGDESQLPWRMAPDWQRESAIKGATGIMAGTITKPSESHDSWLREKHATGWSYGPFKDPEKKEHPCMVEYDQLPAEQRVKDAIFFAVVRACIASMGSLFE